MMIPHVTDIAMLIYTVLPITLQISLFGVFGYAGMLDYQYRRIPLRVWYPAFVAVPVIVVLLGGYYLLWPTVLSVVSFLLWKLKKIGGGDWIALTLAFFGLPEISPNIAVFLILVMIGYLLLHRGVEKRGAPFVTLLALAIGCAALYVAFP